MSDVAQGLAATNDRIARACARAGREPSEVRLVAVSKTVPVEGIREAINAGQLVFGENKAQELRDKADLLGRQVEWHFIGHLQRNKARLVVDRAALVHSVDRWELAQELARRAIHRLPVLVQVDISGEDTKSGVAPREALELCRLVHAEPKLELRGLMGIPRPSEDPEEARPAFRRLAELAREGRAQGLPLRELSMGMSHDLEVAIEEGATLVRVGTAIFGARVGREPAL